MTMHEQAEPRLRQAFAAVPSSEGLRRLDERVARAMARPVPAQRRGLIDNRLVLRPMVVIAAFVVLTGAVAGTLTLLERLTRDSTVGWGAAWERAEVIGIRQEDSGVTLTLERAYADLNQVVVFLEVEGLDAATSREVDRASVDVIAQLRDPSGRLSGAWATSIGGTGDAEPDLAASILSWDGAVLPEAGTWELTVSSVGHGAMVDGSCTTGELADGTCIATDAAMIDGLWQFEFQLPAPMGAIVSTEVSDTNGAATITLTELRLAPSMIAGRLHLEVDGSPAAAWSATIGSLSHDGDRWSPGTNPNYVANPTGAGGFEFRTSAGADQTAGTWEIEISEVWLPSSTTGDLETRVEGPWRLTVVVP